MGAYSRVSISAGASQAQIVSQVNTNTSAIAAVINSNVEGGSGNNIKSATVTRLEMANNASVGKFFGDVFSTLAHVRKGGTVTKVSGLVYAVDDGRWYPTYRGVTPFETYQIYKTSIPNNSVVANRRTFLDMGYDGVIDANDVALGGTATTLQDGHVRFARISASAAINNVTMLGDTAYASTTAYSKDFITGLVVEHSKTDVVNDVIIKAGLRARDSTDTLNISVTSDITVAADASGANGVDTGAIANATTYHLFVIGDSSGANNPAGLLSTSATAPTMPTGYDKFRRLRMIRRGTANWIRGTTIGDTTHLENHTQALNEGAATAYTAINLATAINLNGYPNIFAGALISVNSDSAASSNIKFLTGRIAATAASATSLASIETELPTGGGWDNIGFVPTSGSAGSIKYKGASIAIDVWVDGWKEIL